MVGDPEQLPPVDEAVSDSQLLVEKKGLSRANFHNLLADLNLAKSFMRFGFTKEDNLFICMYRKQRILLSRLFEVAAVPYRVTTVDGSQSKEANICVVDLVPPADTWKDIGFLAKKDGLNVAMSRARDGRIVVGSAKMADIKLIGAKGSRGGRIPKDFAMKHQNGRTVQGDGVIHRGEFL
ncbi:uncharacterized protein RSE6_14358 [Rhynchosporium secalis]|uniref:DNA2/NAM7 helicase-like C-terminal domain-containing protein n=1 Tax=Rhynchosporium secalis TaxID=38038 RepID=A0A1E1MVQ7_RHYSE|nr:uncharacterized protein RSE6_14358 [Rhynchosporium secalis]